MPVLPALRNKRIVIERSIIRPYDMRFFRCGGDDGCGLNFQAETMQSGSRWWEKHHIKYCLGNHYYTRKFNDQSI
jgi:hypothetical protein